MKVRLVFLACVVVLVSGVHADAANYVLYYVDGTHNVRRVGVGKNGQVVGKSTAVTSKGGYDFASVSPDGKRLVGFKAVKREYDKDTKLDWTTWRVFAEQVGKGAFRRTIDSIGGMADSPAAMFSSKGSYVQVPIEAFDLTVEVYSFSTGRKILKTADYLAFSPDERYALGYVWNSSQLGIMDMKSGSKTPVSWNGFDPAWVGSRRIEWVDGSSNVYRAEVQVAAGKLTLSHAARVSKRSASYQRPDRFRGGWERRIHLKPHERALLDQAAFSPDGRLIACPIVAAAGRISRVRMFDGTGKSHGEVSGGAPRWEDENVWNPGGR